MINGGNLVDILRCRARSQPERVAYTFLRDGESDEVHMTYEQLDRQSAAIAGQLLVRSNPGDRVMLVYEAGLDFIVAFFGCLYAGVVAVPAYPPRPNQSTTLLEAMVEDCQAVLGLTTRRVLGTIRPRLTSKPLLAKLQWLVTDSPVAAEHACGRIRAIAEDAIAYLQYTSGSTGTPKGVVITHGNLVHNERMIRTAFEHDEHSVHVGWLPLFHDMGLVGMVLQALYVGARCVLLPPLHFMQKPLRWLQAITRYRATTSGAPNFAYDLCVSRIRPEQRMLLDLGSWTLAYNAAEPVRAETLERFADAFEPSGFRRDAFYPCYGLAEATVFVTGGNKGQAPLIDRFDEQALEQNRAVPAAEGCKRVACGFAWLGQTVTIVDPHSCTPCRDGCVGEIWVSGPSVARGYWQRPEESEKTFGARLAGSGESPFLRTGDLGFVQQGRLFVTGRLKDLIVVRGNNHYPQDIERTAQRSHPALRPEGGAAFALAIEGEERLVLVQELCRSAYRHPDAAPILGAIRAAVVAEHGLLVHAVMLIEAGSLPRTTSGKVRRRACREQLRNGTLQVRAADYGNPDCRRGR